MQQGLPIPELVLCELCYCCSMPKIVDVILSRKHYLMENMTVSISPKYQLVFGRHRVKRNVFFKNIDRDALFNILELQDMFIR
jgi:hypothetical protein